MRSSQCGAASLLLIVALLSVLVSVANAGSLGATFGNVVSAATLTTTPRTVLNYTVSSSGSWGVMTHLWTTGDDSEDVIFSYYIDGESVASIQFTPSMAAGVGFSDTEGPWGTSFVGKGAKTGAWYFNGRIPFQKNILITAQAPTSKSLGFYVIVRGAEDLPISIGGVPIPLPDAKLKLLKIENQIYQPLDLVAVVDLPTGSGVFFFHTLSVNSQNLNFLEGCYHLNTPYDQEWPGTLLSSGTEDYYVSAYYFDGGQFHFPLSGFTHINTTDAVQLSAYRSHETDPITFNDGVKILWRNGDMVDPVTYEKCFTLSGGLTAGNPSASTVNSYSWVYVW